MFQFDERVIFPVTELKQVLSSASSDHAQRYNPDEGAGKLPPPETHLGRQGGPSLKRASQVAASPLPKEGTS